MRTERLNGMVGEEECEALRTGEMAMEKEDGG